MTEKKLCEREAITLDEKKFPLFTEVYNTE